MGLYDRDYGRHERTPWDRVERPRSMVVTLIVINVVVFFVDLILDGSNVNGDPRTLIDKYFAMEDPTAVREIGLELWMEAPVGHLTLRGIIDRLELDDDGELVVTDYKTGRAPTGNYEQKSLAGVHFYSFLCEAVLGKRA